MIRKTTKERLAQKLTKTFKTEAYVLKNATPAAKR